VKALRLIGGVLIALLGWSAASAAPPVQGSMGDRVRACTACHGEHAIRIAEGYVPRIQGKPAGYLFNQLVNYREARRHNSTMQYMVSHLSDAYLWDIARYFASREVPYPKPASPPDAPALLERGRQLVRHGDSGRKIPPCEACHGERLAGVLPATPGLIGLPRHYIMGQLGAFRVGERHAAPPDCMAKVAGRLSRRDVEAVAAWLSSRPLPENTRPRQEPVRNPPLECGSVERPEG